MTDIQATYLETIYNDMVNDKRLLPVRAQNVLKSNVTFRDLLRYKGKNISGYSDFLNYYGCSRGTLDSIYRFNTDTFLKLADSVLNSSDSQVNDLLLRHDFRFLPSEPLDFAIAFRNLHGHLPLPYLLIAFLKATDIRDISAYSLYHGITSDDRITTEQLGKLFGITRERARQICRNPIECDELRLLSAHPDWSHYDNFISKVAISDFSDDWAQLQHRELLSSLSFRAFAWAMALMGSFVPFEFGEHTLMLSKSVDIDVKSLIDKIELLFSDKHHEDVTVDITEILSGYTSEAIEVASFVVSCHTGASLSGTILFIPRNTIDVDLELQKILMERNETMTIGELTIEFNRRNGNVKECSDQYLLAYIYRSSAICSCGKTGHYGLRQWTDTFFGSIRDMLYDIVSASDIPVHIETLFDKVSRRFPTTTIPSLAANMDSDTAGRFVKFEASYYGITGKQYPEGFALSTDVRNAFTFEQRMASYISFVDRFHRLPFTQGSEEEVSLYRWSCNVRNRNLTTTDEQYSQYSQMIDGFTSSHIPRNSVEFSFRTNCQQYADYCRSHQSRPDRYSEPLLAKWYDKSYRQYKEYTDFRKTYFTELLENLSTISFKYHFFGKIISE